jgi:hypothetical protein
VNEEVSGDPAGVLAAFAATALIVAQPVLRLQHGADLVFVSLLLV